MDNIHIISQQRTLLDALKRINDIRTAPLVLFVVDEQNRMCGTITDGDIRRALIRGLNVDDEIFKGMHRNFNFLRKGETDDVANLHRQHEMKMRLVPVLDAEDRICEIVNLEKYRNRLPVDAVLMAGGKGERLRPLTEKTPKPLIKVGDKCIIDYNIDRLLTYGINRISVTVNYLGEQIERHFQEEREGVKIATVREPEYLGTIGSIKFVKAFYNDTVLVMNSDLFTNIDYEDFYLHFCQHDADMSVAAVPYVVKVPYGVFNLEGRDIKGVLEKPTYSYYANAGIYLIKKACLGLIPENVFFNATDFMDKLIATRHKVIRYPISGFWIDIGQHDELARAKEMVKHIKGF
ncbi:nucleotidyltransferase family protein [uncultured Bacteroides sp.]|uniref:nucleotidyltransferase family protein n=1 Tax=uncultured Bacteroides sp. TaxID=162156 RepID=UPI0025DB5AAE|nr:nucleotidyltransferase family protein [uncultured Bacteroides sp.]